MDAGGQGQGGGGCRLRRQVDNICRVAKNQVDATHVESIGELARYAENQVHCIGLLNGGPAEQSGVLQTGDVLLKVDGIAVFGKTHSDVLDLIMGAADTLVELELLQGDAVRAFSKVTNACLKVTISYSDGTCQDS